jgi:phosphomannomutase/phosphoglucomutase
MDSRTKRKNKRKSGEYHVITKTHHPGIFREYDIRGIAEKDFSSAFVQQLAQAFGTVLRKTQPQAQKIAIGQDCRLTSPLYASILMESLCKQGFEVYDLGICPSPVTYFSTHFHRLDGAIMVTGSHNSADFNGFKICMGKDTIYGEQLQELKEVIQKEAYAQPQEGGSIRSIPIIEQYITYVTSGFSKLARKKVVVDAGNATAGTVAPELLRRLGLEVIELFCELDGRFPNHHPDPTMPENLQTLCQKVLEEKADFGVAFDGDADRIGVVDDKGNILYGDDLMIIFSRAILKQKPGSVIISEVKSSDRLYNDIKKHGGVPLMWKTGHSLIKAKIKQTQAALAGEMSGHIFFADRYYGFDDGIYAAARFAEIASATPGPVSELLSNVPRVFNTPEIRMDCSDSQKFQLVARAKQLLADFPCIDIDGIRVDFKDGWGLVRASNTQPSIVMRFEAISADRLQEIRSHMEAIVSQAALELSTSVSAS